MPKYSFSKSDAWLVDANSPTVPKAVRLFGTDLHPLTMQGAIRLLLRWMTEDQWCRYVVTPNVDHVVKLQADPAMRAAYHAASLICADGWPLVTASRLLGRPLPERVAGSDLVPGIFAAGHIIPHFRVFLLGAAPGVAERAADRIHERWPHVQVSGLASPKPGFTTDHRENARLLNTINFHAPHFLVVGLGAPQQEIWLQQHARSLNARVAIACGATIDFLAGEQTRAPEWIQRARLEWLFRLASDPRRLTRRYAKGAIVFPRIVAAEWRRLRAESQPQF